MGFFVVFLFWLSLISVTEGNFDIDFPQLEFGERKVDLKGDAMFVHNNPVVEVYFTILLTSYGS